MSEVRKKRILLAVLVYNGRRFVPDCLSSVARARNCEHQVDVLILDDCSTDPGWSAELSGLAGTLAMEYYRSPRNLGIPRTMNLALRRTLDEHYDYVVLLNSDLVLPLNFVRSMVAPAEADESVGSVTAWSNNVSIFSLPHGQANVGLASQHSVDWLSSVLESEFPSRLMDIPSAVGFCMLISATAIRNVGLFDPIFGRGYCEEVDWSLRCHALGFRSTLSTSLFVYHFGSGSTRSAGLLEEKNSTVPAHEAIIDWRFPDFREQIKRFESLSCLPEAVASSHRQIVLSAARQYGYCLEASWFKHQRMGDGFIWFSAEPSGEAKRAVGNFMGFKAELGFDKRQPIENMKRLVGVYPQKVKVSDRGPFSEVLLSEAAKLGITALDLRSYPERV